MSEAAVIAVTGMNARADNPAPGLAVARCLKESGRALRIVGLGYDALDPGLYSGHCDAGYLLPFPGAGERAVLDRLEAIHEREGLSLVIPCLDAELPVFAALAPRLAERGIATLLPRAEQLQSRDKSRLAALCEGCGIPHPETRTVASERFFTGAEAKDWDYPFVVKGPYYDAQVVHSAEEATAAFRRIAAAWGLPILVQRHVAGEEVNLCGLGDGAGGLLGAVMMKKRAVTEKGKAWSGVTVHDERLLHMAQVLVARLSWRGPLEVEAVRSPEGRHYLIEINPRFPAWVYLAAAAGCNLPAALAALAMGEPAPRLPQPALGVLFVRAAEEIIVPLAEFENVVMAGCTREREALS